MSFFLDNVEQSGSARHTTDGGTCVRFACWIPEAKKTHSEHEILFAFPQQQWLHERASVLPYTSITCRVYTSSIRYRIGAPPLKTTKEYWVSLQAEHMMYIGKGKTIPVQASTGPEGFKEFEAPTFHDSRYIKMVRLSSICTGRLYPAGNMSGTHFC